MTGDAVEGFVAHYDGDSPDADRSYFSHLRGLARFMRTRGLEAYELARYSSRNKPRPPTHLLSSAEIDEFFAVAANDVPYTDPGGPGRPVRFSGQPALRAPARPAN
ncbi:MAG: hypothetical protein R2722_13585 [Tessaracoccus sp.]